MGLRFTFWPLCTLSLPCLSTHSIITVAHYAILSVLHLFEEQKTTTANINTLYFHWALKVAFYLKFTISSVLSCPDNAVQTTNHEHQE